MKYYLATTALLLIIVGSVSLWISRNYENNFEREISNYVNQEGRSGRLDKIGIYIKKLESGKEYHLYDYDQKFTGASLGKVGVLMAVLKESEEDPQTLGYTAVFTPKLKDLYIEEVQDLTEPLSIGGEYTVLYLLTQAIKYSDNLAIRLLQQRLPRIPTTHEVFGEVGAIAPRTSAETISPQEYSKVFLSLYNSSYLNEENSERALDLLSHTVFTSGIDAGVPDEIRVAHKFGRYSGYHHGVEKHGLNDCGIVFTESPYFICVMTVGNNLKDLELVIQNVSKIVYDALRVLDK